MTYAFIAFAFLDIVAAIVITKQIKRLKRDIWLHSERIEDLQEWQWKQGSADMVHAEIDEKTFEAVKKGKTIYYELHCSATATGKMFLTRCKR